jgi:hypothetical protein
MYYTRKCRIFIKKHKTFYGACAPAFIAIEINFMKSRHGYEPITSFFSSVPIVKPVDYFALKIRMHGFHIRTIPGWAAVTGPG